MERLERFRASDGYEFAFRHRPSPERISTRVVLLHGIRSHGGWYTRSAQRLAEAGHEVYFLDRRGAGRNSEARGDTPSFRRLLDDVGEFLQTLPRDQPIVLGGISWGGKLAVGLPYRAPGLVDALVLIAPGLKPQVHPPWRTRVQVLVEACRRPTRLLPIPLNAPELFTASPRGQDFIRNDPLGLTEATARFLFHSVGLDVYLRRARKRVTLPTLLQLAGQDRILDNAKVLRFVQGFPGTQLQVHEYPEAHHTLEFEDESHPWLTDLIHWLNTLARKV